MTIRPKLVVGAGGKGIVTIGVLGVCMMKGTWNNSLERCSIMTPGMLRSVQLECKTLNLCKIHNYILV